TGERSGRQNWLLDEGDRGDEYTYSYAGPTLGSRDVPGQRTTSAAAERAAVSVSLVLRLPAALRGDRLARSPELVDCPVRMTISLDSGARRVDVAVTVDNRARDHRLRVLCETGTRTLTHRAGAAFALIERANRPPIGRGWIEPATYDACVHDLVAVSGATRGLAVGVDGLPADAARPPRRRRDPLLSLVRRRADAAGAERAACRPGRRARRARREPDRRGRVERTPLRPRRASRASGGSARGRSHARQHRPRRDPNRRAGGGGGCGHDRAPPAVRDRNLARGSGLRLRADRESTTL